MNSKRKILLILLCSVLLIIIGGVIVFAYNDNTSNKNSILTEEKLSNTKNTYEEITNTDKFNKDLLIQKVNEYKLLIDSNNSKRKTLNYSNIEEECVIKVFNNERDSQIESVMDFKDEIFCLDAENGNLIHYVQKNPSLSSSKLNEIEIKQIGLQLYESIKETINGDYTYTELEQYDDEIWTIRFNKYYNNLMNPGEAVKISFSPESREIVSIVILDNPFANNNIEVSEESAFNVAKKYMEKTTSTDMKMEIRIVRPNYFWYKDISEYKNIESFRVAYVFTCNNEANVEIYVDCTTGEVIGGNMIVGGEM